jgi:hypothetical protein
MQRWLALALVVTASACSLAPLAPLATDARAPSDDGAHGDAKNHDARLALDGPSSGIVVTGTVVDSGNTAIGGASVAAYTTSSGVEVVSAATSPAGKFSLTLSAAGGMVSDYLEASITGYEPTYYWFPGTLTSSPAALTIELLTSTDVSNFAADCHVGGANNTPLLNVEVLDGTSSVSGASVSAQPGRACYEGPGGTYSQTNTTTVSDGNVFVFNLPAQTYALTATETGDTFGTTTVTLVDNAVVQTVIEQIP